MKITLATIVLATASSASLAWQTKVVKDEFSGKATTVHTTVSRNSLRLEFPYQGRNLARLAVVQLDAKSASVYLSLDKGQINCPIDYCSVSVKVDEAEPRNFVVKPMGGGTHKEISFSYPPALLDYLKDAKRFKIRVEIYANGHQTLDFLNPTALPVDLSALNR